ncbi:uncharacterized protein LOC143448314 [Clavelina lepadiformis]|uniref:Uncharacterized protein n=1 Tax=Clavelina lepadiformis TaxID=159417 RepID=A0ABP0G5N2_CLALP
MVVSTVAGIEKRASLHQIFNERNSFSAAKSLALISQKDVSNHLGRAHIPVKRIASCPPGQNAVAIPKRSRSTTPYDISSQQTTTRNENSCMSSNCVPPSATIGSGKGLTMVPANSSRITLNCCPKDLCFGTSSSTFSTPPYGFASKQVADRPVPKDRRSMLRKQVSRISKKKIYKDKLTNNEANTNKKSFGIDLSQNQPNALVVYNSFLRQLEKQVVRKPSLDGTKPSCRYNPGFMPTLTSTPHGKRSSPATHSPLSKGPVTSDYYSKPSEGYSQKSYVAEDSFCAFLRYIEEGLVAEKRKKLYETEVMKAPMDSIRNRRNGTTSSHRFEVERQSCVKSRDGAFFRHRPLTSTPQQESTYGAGESHSNRTSVRNKLPGMYPIGAPRAASSPITTMQQQRPTMVVANRPVEQMWRPWC